MVKSKVKPKKEKKFVGGSRTAPKKKTPLPEPPKIPKMEFYEAQVGCWNCDEQYTIDVLKGHITPQFLVDAKIKCRSCGCDTLKMLSEYNIEKDVMKDVILHHRIEQLHEGEGQKEPSKDHNHFG